MTYLERVREAISKLREYFRTLVSSSEVVRLRQELEAATVERENMVGALEAFVEEVKAPPVASSAQEDSETDSEE